MKRLSMTRYLTRMGLAGIVAAAVTGLAQGQTTLHVDEAAAPGGDGSSWTNAYQHLQDALDLAREPGADVKNIHVAQGVYRPDQGESQTPGDRDAAFELTSGLTLRGGFAGLGHPDPDLHDPAQFVTMLCGDLEGNDGPDFENYDDNSRTVVLLNHLDAPVLLEGVTVRGGNANVDTTGQDPGHLGGGLYAIGSELMILNSRFIENRADFGGGVYAVESELSIQSSELIDNLAVDTGGGLYVDSCNWVLLEYVTFLKNTSLSIAGGAAMVGKTDAELRHVEFDSNYASEVVGALLLHVETCAVIEDCLFHENVSKAAFGAMIHGSHCNVDIKRTDFIRNDGGLLGGALLIQGSPGGTTTKRMIDCRFIGNTASLAGGAAITADTDYINCVFSGNSAPSGGAMFVGNIKVSNLINCTIVGNTGHALSQDAGMALYGGSGLNIDNSIFWANSPAHFDASAVPSLTINHSNIGGGWTGPGGNNIDADPMFLQPAQHDYRLQFGSPCINAGDNNAIPDGIEYDILGNPRIIDGIVDMGAYEGGYEPENHEALGGIPAGWFGWLFPNGHWYNEFEQPGVFVWNVNVDEPNTVSVTQFNEGLHPEAGGHETFGPALRIDAELPAGTSLYRVGIPFTADDLNGADPLTVDIATYDESMDAWILATWNNVQPSPTTGKPFGQRFMESGDEAEMVNLKPGDGGVFWNHEENAGFAWINVDHLGDFALAVRPCAGDIAPPNDGVVGVADLLLLISVWNDANSPFDVTYDGTIGVADAIHLFDTWGPCRE